MLHMQLVSSLGTGLQASRHTHMIYFLFLGITSGKKCLKYFYTQFYSAHAVGVQFRNTVEPWFNDMSRER